MLIDHRVRNSKVKNVTNTGIIEPTSQNARRNHDLPLALDPHLHSFFVLVDCVGTECRHLDGSGEFLEIGVRTTKHHQAIILLVSRRELGYILGDIFNGIALSNFVAELWSVGRCADNPPRRVGQ